MRRQLLISTMLLLGCVLSVVPAHADIRGLPSVTVLADSSLTHPLTELMRTYSRQHNISVTAEYGSSSELAEQIEQGEVADVFISGHSTWIVRLKQLGLLDVYTLTSLAQNRLVFAVPTRHVLAEHYKEKTDAKQFLNAITTKEVPVAILVVGDPEDTPLGVYTAEVLRKFGLLKKLKPVLLPAINSAQALYLIAQGENPGIIYASDAYNNTQVKVIAEIDPSLHESITYQAAVVAGEYMEQAREFVEYLKSPEAQKVFESYGFITN